MARNDPQVNLRMPLPLKDQLQAASEENGRSLTAEIVARLATYDQLAQELHTTSAIRASIEADLQRRREELLDTQTRVRQLELDLAEARGRFDALNREGNLLLPLPPILFKRIVTQAHLNGWSPEIEALAALSKAYPPPEFQMSTRALHEVAVQRGLTSLADDLESHMKAHPELADLPIKGESPAGQILVQWGMENLFKRSQ